MSRGPGRIQRAILAAVEAAPVFDPDGIVYGARRDDITTALFGASPTTSQRASVGRAVTTLARDTRILDWIVNCDIDGHREHWLTRLLTADEVAQGAMLLDSGRDHPDYTRVVRMLGRSDAGRWAWVRGDAGKCVLVGDTYFDSLIEDPSPYKDNRGCVEKYGRNTAFYLVGRLKRLESPYVPRWPEPLFDLTAAISQPERFEVAS